MSSTYRHEAIASRAVVPACGRAAVGVVQGLIGGAVAPFPTMTGTATTTRTDSPPGPLC